MEKVCLNVNNIFNEIIARDLISGCIKSLSLMSLNQMS